MNNSRQSDIPGYLYALDGMRAISLIFYSNISHIPAKLDFL